MHTYVFLNYHIFFIQYMAMLVWKSEKFSLIEKIFRQINYLVISQVKTLLSRNFCQKCVRLDFQCGNFGNSLSNFFDKTFVKATVLLNKLIQSWFHDIFFKWKTVSLSWKWKLLNFNLTHFWQKFRESNVLTKEITKELIWRKFFSIFHFSTLRYVMMLCCGN